VDFETLQQRLHYRFADLDLLERALTHRSVGGGNNERLEFLGDGVLNFVIAEEVFRRRPVATEGELSRLRANLVNKPSLASLARDLGLGEQVRLGTGELKSGGHRRDSILADGLEAIFGAVYLDGGFAVAQEVIARVYRDRLADLPDLDQLKDPKTRLQEHLQAGGMPLPDYEVVEVTGQAHAQVFRVSCRIADVEAVTLGEAGSRRKAEQAAAQAMLQRLAGERAE
jgi:ribonuclease-3